MWAAFCAVHIPYTPFVLSHDADEAMGRSRAAFYSRFQVSVRSPRIMSFASAGGAISVSILEESLRGTRSPACSWLRQSRRGYALASFFRSNVVSSRQIANRIRLRRRASATTAMRLPRRAAMPSTHARSVPLPPWRQHTQAA